jgi:hypothetical protein
VVACCSCKPVAVDAYSNLDVIHAPLQAAEMLFTVSAQAKQTGSQDLPANLLMAVLGYMDGRSLLQAAPTVCKAWKRACKEALHKLDVSFVNTSAKMEGAAAWLMLHGHTLLELSYKVRHGDELMCQVILSGALVQLTQLQSLDLSECSYSMRGRTEALTSLQKLTSLRLACCELRERDLRPLSALVALQKLSLDGSRRIDAGCPHFINLSRALTQLTSLNLESCYAFLNAWGLSELKPCKSWTFHTSQISH